MNKRVTEFLRSPERQLPTTILVAILMGGLIGLVCFLLAMWTQSATVSEDRILRMTGADKDAQLYILTPAEFDSVMARQDQLVAERAR